MRRAIWLLSLLAAACSNPMELDDRWADPEKVTFAEALHVDLSQMTRNSSGLYWQDLAEGEGDSVKVGQNVRVHYTAWLPDGTEVETTRGGEPLQFALGYGLAIRGVDEGIVGMRIGGVRRLVIPPSLAYGRRGKQDCDELNVCVVLVPPLTTLVYEIERRPPLAQ